MSNAPKPEAKPLDATPEIDVSAVTQAPPGPEVATVDNPPDQTPVAPEEEAEPVLSDGHCPLVIGEIDPQSKSRVVETVGNEKVVRREPAVALQSPTPCPNCGKLFERHSLVTSKYGEKDCAVAMSYKERPELKAYFDAANSGDAKAANVESKKLGKLGESLQRVFSPETKKAKA